MTDDVIEFLKESNRIENVTDSDSLQQAIYAWEYLMTEPELTHGVILKTHKILMLHQKLRPDQKGYYRKEDVVLTRRVPHFTAFDAEPTFRTTVIKKFPPHKGIRDAMTLWLTGANMQQTENDIKNGHIAFEFIHPFIDGNGRVGRMLMNWQRLKIGEEILIIKYFERDAYYKWFQDVRSE